ncbi:MAG: alpha/beta hydrolase [Bacteroidetes bacterium]|nr:alpha/beta hydrolase [Bacteroidota bacterium]
MAYSSGFISVGKEQLHYLKSGRGSSLLVMLHGYGNSAEILMPIATHVEEKYTILSLDLPHHGKSLWTDGVYLEPAMLDELVEQLCREYNVSQISLLGYSMGGRVCLKILEQSPGKVDNVILLASDGLTSNPFYYFLTRMKAGKYLFSSFLSKPERYLPLIKMARKWKIVQQSHYKLAMRYIQEKEDRAFLLKVWPCMSLLLPDYNKLKAICKSNKTKVHVFMGAYDNVIPVSHGHAFEDKMKNISLHVVEKGHLLFDEDTIPQIVACL